MSFYKDKVAIITGGASGIGKALGEELARRGAAVILADIAGDAVKQVAEKIKSKGFKAEGAALDVADFDRVKGVVEKVREDHGRIDYIFNNAGIAVIGDARDASISDWRNVLDVNLYGVVNGSVSAYSVMVEQGFGHIVNTASIEGLVPFPITTSYVAAKHGVVGLSSALRIEGAALGVNVSVVCPGYVRTPMVSGIGNKLVKANLDLDEVFSKLGFISISPEESAEEILRGVKRNKAFIVVTLAARIGWVLHRIYPNMSIWFMRFAMSRIRKKALTTG